MAPESALECYQTPSPIYYPQSVARVVPFNWLRSFLTRKKVLAMLLFSPLAVLGALIGLGDNLNVIAKKIPQ